MGYRLSPSSLKLMEDCPRCFWLAQHKVWKRPSGPFPTLPSGMDRILKVHFDRFRDKGELPPELCEDGNCSGMVLFDDDEKLKVWQNNFKGIVWEDGENVLRGAVDNILVKGKKLIVLDYKTRGYPLKENTAAFSQNQLDIYNFLLRKNGYDTEDYAFLLFYVPREVLSNGDFVFDVKLVRMATDCDRAEELFRSAIELLEGECPEASVDKKGKVCGWCLGVDEE